MHNYKLSILRIFFDEKANHTAIIARLKTNFSNCAEASHLPLVSSLQRGWAKEKYNRRKVYIYRPRIYSRTYIIMHSILIARAAKDAKRWRRRRVDEKESRKPGSIRRKFPVKSSARLQGSSTCGGTRQRDLLRISRIRRTGTSSVATHIGPRWYLSRAPRLHSWNRALHLVSVTRMFYECASERTFLDHNFHVCALRVSLCVVTLLDFRWAFIYSSSFRSLKLDREEDDRCRRKRQISYARLIEF